ncbi:MAG TPA: electron transfer flavoprotein subunit alpha/FixB family protein [Chloroflexia bacterium]|nr:electron transfer flavoprotein subunit alpha/FixB family protein [Chloroflexia bacterium]
MDSQRDDYRGIWAITEQDGGRVRPASARLLGVARGLADASGAPVTALLLGAPPEDAAAEDPAAREAISYGADGALLLRDAHLASFSGAAYSAAISTLAAVQRPAVILFADGAQARDLAPRLAWRTGGGLVSAVEPATLDLDPATGTLLATRREWSGRLMTTYTQPQARPQIVTVRVAGAPSPYADDWRYGDATASDLSAVAWPDTALTSAAPADSPSSAQVSHPADDEPAVLAVARALRGARCVVVGGRGIGSAAGFAEVQRLAAALGGEWGATGGAVEAGWAPPERAVSLYGTTVRPDLYIGCGVSGSPPHVVAMQQARTIVAINTDPQAPIFRWAHYAVVADAPTVVGQLLERLGHDREAVPQAHA